MTNRLSLEIVAALLGATGALTAVLACTVGLLWLTEESSRTQSLGTFLATIALLLLALGAAVARRRMVRMLTERQADALAEGTSVDR